ncbi:MAG TPA: hypothetical protein VD970_11820 [Acetobacteraceae bacterium]|nr:hypothetical protein [Acetobacteraceae bacterium]
MAPDTEWAMLARLRDAVLEDLRRAILLWDRRQEPDPDRIREKALQKSLQDAYASIESAMLRIVVMAEEPRPTGERWHDDLLTAVTLATARRPAFAPALVGELDELRSFRHVAVHNYLRFRMDRAAPAVAAARVLLAELTPAFEEFGHAFGLLPPQPE